jgi:hypothetical protein
MQSIIEIIGSTIIGGMLLLLILTSKINVGRASNAQAANSKIQSNLTTVAQMIEFDTKNIGYRVTTGNPISQADSNRITFNKFNDVTSLVDSTTYYFNTLQNKLYRNSVAVNLGVSNFLVRYYDINGAVTNSVSAIKSFKIAVMVQDTFKYEAADTNRIRAYWEKTFKPQNL